jgi:hypothetical protein
MGLGAAPPIVHFRKMRRFRIPGRQRRAIGRLHPKPESSKRNISSTIAATDIGIGTGHCLVDD